MKHVYRLLLASWIVVTLYSACGGGSSNQIPRFERTNCRFPLHITQKEDSTVTCGDLVVWENRAKEESRTIRLHVARFHGADQTTSPTVYLIGGPGVSASEMSPYINTAFINAIANPGDFIIFDQRGVGKSTPSLYCNELDQAFQDLPANAVPEDQKDATISALANCSARLASDGVDLTAYNTIENAADVDDLRLALGYKTINLWGASYGSRLGLEILRNHAEGLRSAVIEAIAPAQVAWSFEIGKNFEDSLSRLFQACKNDTTCHENFGELDTTLSDTFFDLNTSPLNLPAYTDTLNGYNLISILFSLMYVSDTYPSIPRLILAAHERNSSEVLNILQEFEGVLEDYDTYWGMRASVVCQDHVRYMQAEDLQNAYQGVRTEIREALFPYSETYLEFCKDWPMGASMPSIMDPVSSRVPTLIMNGEFDPITPAKYGRMVADSLSQSRSFEFPNTGHGTTIGPSKDCAYEIILSFLAAPTDTIDTSCIQDIEPISFEEPATYRIPHFPRRDLLPSRLKMRPIVNANHIEQTGAGKPWAHNR